MKKQILIPIVIFSTLILIGVFYYFLPTTIGKGIEPAEVSQISVFDGTNGKSFTIDNSQDIQYIVENIQSHSMQKDGLSLGYMGFHFRVQYLDSKDKVITEFILNSDDSIRKDPFFYRCNGGLCIDYLTAIENNIS